MTAPDTPPSPDVSTPDSAPGSAQTADASPPEASPDAGSAVLLFDGVCNLCNGFVNFLIDHDPEGHIRVGALQSDAARPYLHAFGLDPSYLDSVVLIERGRVYQKSTAALRVARRLEAPWPLAYYAFIGIPRVIRDRVYDVVAGKRYDWFGKREACRMPTPELQARFIGGDADA